MKKNARLPLYLTNSILSNDEAESIKIDTIKPLKRNQQKRLMRKNAKEKARKRKEDKLKNSTLTIYYFVIPDGVYLAVLEEVWQ